MTAEERKTLWQATFLFVALGITSGCGPSTSAKSHALQIAYFTNNHFEVFYEGNGTPGQRGWSRNYDGLSSEYTFEGLHIPNGYAWVTGDTNYINALAKASITFENPTSYVFYCKLQTTSQVPMKFHFFGINDITNTGTNKPDAIFEFQSGQHTLVFTGRVHSAWENADEFRQ